MLGFTASRTQVSTYLFGVALFSISFLVFLNSSVSFVITQRIGQQDDVGDAVGTLGFADELVALVACPLWGVVSDRVGVRAVAVVGYIIVGISLWAFVQARNVYPQLLLARLLFSLGATATATMVTAILPTMTLVTHKIEDQRSPSRENGRSHNVTPSISSELTITPARYRSQSPEAPSMPRAATGASTSYLAGLVGTFTGLGALLALGLFLPLPTEFQRVGESASASVADAFYVVAVVALLVALGCLVGLRGLPGEDEKGMRRLFNIKSDKGSETPLADRPALSYARLLWDSILLGFKSKNIGLGYLGGFVARASSVAISLFIPLFTNAYFLRTGRCSGDPDDPTDIKHACPRAYLLAAALTGTSQLVALICAPIFGFLAGRYVRYNIPLIVAALVGIAGYTAFGALRSPDPKSEEGSGGVFAIAALLGLSQIGAIVCSLGLLAKGIQNEGSEHHDPDSSSGDEPNGNGHNVRNGFAHSPTPPAASAEEEPLLGTQESNYAIPAQDAPSSTPNHLRFIPSKSLTHLKGSIAGTYSLAGGAGILLLTKAGGALFDSAGAGSPFYMMAAFNAVLLVVSIGVAVKEVFQARQRDT